MCPPRLSMISALGFESIQPCRRSTGKDGGNDIDTSAPRHRRAGRHCTRHFSCRKASSPEAVVMKPWPTTTTPAGCRLSVQQATDTTAACQYQGQLTGENLYIFEPIVMLHKRQDQIVQRRIRRMVRQPIGKPVATVAKVPAEASGTLPQPGAFRCVTALQAGSGGVTSLLVGTM
jgi:hypothetical protein